MAIEASTSASTAILFRGYGEPGILLDGRKKEVDLPQGRRIEDLVDFSDTARDTAKLLGSLPPLLEVLGSFEESLAAFGGELGNKFQAAGIDTSEPIDLSVDANGQVRVTNDHPDKAKIEAIFADDADFAKRFRGLSAAAEIQKAVEDHKEFSKAYEKDPEAAQARLTQLFSDKASDEVRFRFIETNLTVSFAGKRL
jgi:hypothetical protein